MITVHHLNNSRSQRILWLLEELALDYEIKHYERDPKTRRAPPSLRLVHPLGRAPVITDTTSGETVTTAETGAIIEYIISNHGNNRLRPELGSEAYNQYVHFLHYAEGSAMLPLLLALYVGFLGDAGQPLQPLIAGEMKAHFDYIEYHLTRQNYFAGEGLSGADIMMVFPLEGAKARGRLINHPACTDFVDRMQARPAYLRALERGGHYDFGPKGK